MVTQLPGFSDLVHDAQSTFRALLEALSQPGKPQQIEAQVTSPIGLTPACAAACLTLLDLETQVWLSPDFDPQVKGWLLFHSGCRFTENPQTANFAVIKDASAMPKLSMFNQGTAVEPETSTTLLVQGSNWQGGKPVVLRGPGILESRAIGLSSLPDFFWSEWATNVSGYPLGVDIYFFTEDAVVGLPRTASPI